MHAVNRLSPLDVARLKETGRYADGGGLYLQVTRWEKEGEEWVTKAWLLRYMRNGRAREMGLGSVRDFSLKEARDRARAMRQLLADGRDPLAERRQTQQAAKLEAARTITFKAASAEYIKAHQAGWKNGKHADQWEATLETYAFPVFGNLPVAEIDTGLMVRVLEPIWKTKTETASRVRGRIENILAWATVRGYRTGDNPARWRGHLDKLLAEKAKVAKVRHQPAMHYTKVGEFMAELRDNGSISAKALELTILTAARTHNTIGATWAQFDLDAKVWTIPGPEMKGEKGKGEDGRLHRVPLADRAVEILKGLPRLKGNEFVFVGAHRGKGLSNMAMLELLKGMRPGLTVHGFRSTFRDWAAECTNFPRELAEKALGHVLGDKVEAAYQRGDLLEKRRRLMDAWAGYCSKPAGNGNGHPMKGKAP